MRKAILINSKINASVFIFVYLFKSFVIWQITNPFDWFINIPKYDYDIRGTMLIVFLIWQGIQLSVIQMNLSEKINTYSEGGYTPSCSPGASMPPPPPPPPDRKFPYK